jgi:hypothetical protein
MPDLARDIDPGGFEMSQVACGQFSVVVAAALCMAATACTECWCNA